MAKFQIYEDRAGEHRWRLKALNGEIVCVSEGYSSKQNAENSVDWTKANAKDASVEYL